MSEKNIVRQPLKIKPEDLVSSCGWKRVYDAYCMVMAEKISAKGFSMYYQFYAQNYAQLVVKIGMAGVLIFDVDTIEDINKIEKSLHSFDAKNHRNKR